VITIEDFQKVELLTARVTAAVAHPNADRLFVLTLEDGPGTRQVVAGIRDSYAPEALVGKTVIVVANLAPKPLRGVESCGMVLAVRTGDRTRVLTVDGDAPPGLRVS
jgi:methionine--tRNA ligase beta chain